MLARCYPLGFRNASGHKKGTPAISREPNTASANMGLESDNSRFHVRPVMVCIDVGAEKGIKTSSPASIGSQTSSVGWK